MNAYELAEKLNDAVNKNEKHVTLDIQAMLMLRQQADRIAELEKELKRTKFAWNLAENEIERLAPQTKPLSDEEIMDIAEQSDYSPLEIEMGYDYEIRIARAIEERHGIK